MISDSDDDENKDNECCDLDDTDMPSNVSIELIFFKQPNL